MRNHLHLNSELFWLPYPRSSWGSWGCRSPDGLGRNTVLELRSVWVSGALGLFSSDSERLLNHLFRIANVTIIILNCFLPPRAANLNSNSRHQDLHYPDFSNSPPTSKCPQTTPPAVLGLSPWWSHGTARCFLQSCLYFIAFLRIPPNLLFGVCKT